MKSEEMQKGVAGISRTPRSSVDIPHEFRAQDGTVLSTETYQQTFVLAQGANFTDDYSTPTRFKEFSATLTQVGSDSMVSISWFADVSTFNSVDLDTAVVIPDKQQQGTAAGRHRFSSSPGHDTTTYTLTAVRN